jgi:hypothetical protein
MVLGDFADLWFGTRDCSYETSGKALPTDLSRLGGVYCHTAQ